MKKMLMAFAAAILLTATAAAELTETKIYLNDTQVDLLYDPVHSDNAFTMQYVSSVTLPNAWYGNREDYVLEGMEICDGYKLNRELGNTVYEIARSFSYAILRNTKTTIQVYKIRKDNYASYERYVILLFNKH